MESSFFLKGNICHTPAKDGFEIHERSFLLCENGLCGACKTKKTESVSWKHSQPMRRS